MKCIKCQVELISEQNWYKSAEEHRTYKCIECSRKEAMEYHWAHRKEKLAYFQSRKRERLDKRYRKQFGISLDEFEGLIKTQNNLCLVCDEPFNDTRKTTGWKWEKDNPVPDHDHITGKLRGIIHHKCNAGLGLFDDNPEYLIRAANYLRETRK